MCLISDMSQTADTSDGTVLSMENAHLCWISDEVPPDVSKMTVEQKKDYDWMVKKKKQEAEAGMWDRSLAHLIPTDIHTHTVHSPTHTLE